MHFVIVYADSLGPFRTKETLSLLRESGEAHAVCSVDGEQAAESDASLIQYVETSERGMNFLLQHSVLVRHSLVFVGEGGCLGKKLLEFNGAKEIGGSFRFRVVSPERKMAEEEKLRIINSFDGYLQGKVSLSAPKKVFEYIEYRQRAILGCLFGETQRKGLYQYELKNRRFIGTTAMDSELAFVMLNLSRVRSGSLVLDCFSGTGSILLPCAVRGALVLGGDIAGKQFRGMCREHRDKRIRTMLKGTNVYTNFLQYGVEDNAALFYLSDVFEKTPLVGGVIDAIITDPPYGIRETAGRGRATAEQRTAFSSVPDRYFRNALPFVRAVFALAASVLKPGGRLTFFVPHLNKTSPSLEDVCTEAFREEVRATEVLSSAYSRTLFTYTKREA